GGTLLFDEAERLRSTSDPAIAELLSVLLAGYRKGGTVVRLEKVGDGFRPVRFDVYGPKAIGCISGLPPTLASRCIPIPMIRATGDSEKPRRSLEADGLAIGGVRDRLHVLALECGRTFLQDARDNAALPAGLSGRNAELWGPILTLASRFES